MEHRRVAVHTDVPDLDLADTVRQLAGEVGFGLPGDRQGQRELGPLAAGAHTKVSSRASPSSSASTSSRRGTNPTPNPRIAEQLVVSLDTVKKHVSHLLGKLGAANRTAAVTRARQLGLIP